MILPAAILADLAYARRLASETVVEARCQRCGQMTTRAVSLADELVRYRYEYVGTARRHHLFFDGAAGEDLEVQVLVAPCACTPGGEPLPRILSLGTVSPRTYKEMRAAAWP